MLGPGQVAILKKAVQLFQLTSRLEAAWLRGPRLDMDIRYVRRRIDVACGCYMVKLDTSGNLKRPMAEILYRL